MGTAPVWSNLCISLIQCCFNSCTEQSHKDNVQKAATDWGTTVQLSVRAQLSALPLCSWAFLGSLESPAPPLSSWSHLDGKGLSNSLQESSSTQRIVQLSTRVQLYLLALDLAWMTLKIVNEWVLPFIMCSKHPPKWCTYFTTLLGCYCHGWCHVKLHAAVSAHVLCTPHNHAPVYSHFIRSHICRVHLCLAITCHLHFWQNDRDLLCATQSPKQMGFGATIQWYQRGGMHTEISYHRKLTQVCPRTCFQFQTLQPIQAVSLHTSIHTSISVVSCSLLKLNK